MKHTKRILSILLALALGLVLFVPAFAAEEAEPDSAIIAQEGEEEEAEEPGGNQEESEGPAWWQIVLMVLIIPFVLPLSFIIGSGGAILVLPFLPLLGVGIVVSIPVLFVGRGIIWLVERFF